MKPEDTLQYIMDFWIDCSSRDRAIMQIFCSPDRNGYQWRNGEVVCCDIDVERMNRYILKEPVLLAEPSQTSLDIANATSDRRQIRIDQNKRREERRKERMLSAGMLYTEPQCQKVELNNLALFPPSDITSEWQSLLNETIESFNKGVFDDIAKYDFEYEGISQQPEKGVSKTCLTCVYEPIWGNDKYNEFAGECRWPAPPCIQKLMRPISKKKLFDNCSVWTPKINEFIRDRLLVDVSCNEIYRIYINYKDKNLDDPDVSKAMENDIKEYHDNLFRWKDNHDKYCRDDTK